MPHLPDPIGDLDRAERINLVGPVDRIDPVDLVGRIDLVAAARPPYDARE